MVEELRTLTQQYIAQVDSLLAARKPGEGIFGMPDSAKSSPCHQEYFDGIRTQVEQFVQAAPCDTEEAAAGAEYLLRAHKEISCSELASWTLLSVQQHAKDLIPLMPAERKEALRIWFEKAYPRFQRMPIQVQLIKQLKQ